MAAACYGITPILIRIVVERGNLTDSIASGLVAYAAATAVIGLLMPWPGQWRHVISINPVSAKWFIASGALVTVSQMFLYLAFVVAPVSMVMSILQLHLVFRYVLARLLNPQHEVFGSTLVLATAVSMAGALAVSVDPEFLIASVALPDSLIRILRWQLL